MKCRVFLIDAFTAQPFAGNQAAVCLSNEELTTEQMQQIGAEFNLSETAFPRPTKDGESFEKASSFTLRWFTPTTEVPLCGHATLATSHALLNEIGIKAYAPPNQFVPTLRNVNEVLEFHTLSGVLKVKKASKEVDMDFPAYEITTAHVRHFEDIYEGNFSKFDAPSFITEITRFVVPDTIKIRSIAYATKAKKLIIVLDEETTKFELVSLVPDTTQLVATDPEGDFVRGVILTLAPKRALQQGFIDGEEEPYDYACRYFAPWVGIREDPATGSAQCALGPFWSKIMKKNDLYAFQCYPNRGATFRVRVGTGEQAGRVVLRGQSVTVLRGDIDFTNTPTFYEPSISSD